AARRFISPDNYELLSTLAEAGELNLYTYCGNNPVMGYDPTGEFNWGELLSALLVGTVIVAGLFCAAAYLTSGATSFVLSAAAFGAAFGGIGGIVSSRNENVMAGMLSGMISGAAIGATGAAGGLYGIGMLAGQAAETAFLVGVGGCFVAGMSSYAIKTFANGEEFQIEKMFLSGALTSIEGAISFGFGYLAANTGVWTRANKVKDRTFKGGSIDIAANGVRSLYNYVFSKLFTGVFRYKYL
ncbi:MAG: hypothetical protein J1F36_05825, partial [Clostridiales bacterium]|nr:hypothetical protein [Clostridiales bacterium]